MITPKFYSLLRALINTWNKYLGYTVTVTWEEQVFVHYCYDWEDALDWARCYGAECCVVISQALSTQVVVRL